MKNELKYNFLDNMFISFIITYAAGAFCYEGHQPESLMNFLRPLVLIICICTWLYISFFSGLSNKWGFEIFTVIFWLAPQIIIYLADSGPQVFRMSVTMYALSEFFLMMFNTSAEHMGSLFRLGVVPVIFIIVLGCTFAFLAGNFFEDKYKNGEYIIRNDYR